VNFIADTGFILSRWSKSAARRRWFHSYTSKYEPPFVTAEVILAEAGYRLNDDTLAPMLLRDGDYVSRLTLSEHAEDLLWLLKKYADCQMDLADACIVKLAELYPDATILTTDRTDFSIYRTRGGLKLRCDFGPS
jgi:uncharacterized protein